MQGVFSCCFGQGIFGISRDLFLGRDVLGAEKLYALNLGLIFRSPVRTQCALVGAGEEILKSFHPHAPCTADPFKKTVLQGRCWHSLQSVVHGEPWIVETSQEQHVDNRTGQKKMCCLYEE